jgi:hypothetical protein
MIEFYKILGYYPGHMGEGPNSLGPGAADPKTHEAIAKAVRRINEEYQKGVRQFSSTIVRVTGTTESDRAAGQRLKPHTSFMKKGSRG